MSVSRRARFLTSSRTINNRVAYTFELGEAAFGVDGVGGRFVGHLQDADAAAVSEGLAAAVGHVAGLAEVRVCPVAEVLNAAALQVRFDGVPAIKKRLVTIEMHSDEAFFGRPIPRNSHSSKWNLVTFLENGSSAHSSKILLLAVLRSIGAKGPEFKQINRTA